MTKRITFEKKEKKGQVNSEMQVNSCFSNKKQSNI